MKKDKTFIRRRFISFVMSLIMVITMIPTTAFATAIDENVVNEDVVEDVAIDEEILSEEELSEENAILGESTENSTVFDLGDGKKTIVYHSQDVRFEENGQLVDYDPELVEVEDEESESGESLEAYAYENHIGDSSHYIPEKLSEYSQILMEKDDYTIKMLPLDEEI